MGAIRKTPAGRYELCISSKLLPKRLFFTFDTQPEAERYGDDVDKWLKAGVVPPGIADLVNTDAATKREGYKITALIRDWVNTGQPSRTDQDVLGWLFKDEKVAGTDLADLTYTWAEDWVNHLKRERNLAPSSIRQRVQAVSKMVDWHIRHHPATRVINPLRMLPRGYSIYSDLDAKIVMAHAKQVKHDIVRDRRLLPGEAEKIRRVLAGGHVPEGKERSIRLENLPDLAMLFEVIYYTGLRLREAYTLERSQVDFERMVIRAKSTKQRRGVVKFREVPIRPELYAKLSPYARASKAPLLFPFWDGNPGTMPAVSNRLSGRFATVFAHAPCDSLTEHDLRHEATCQWYELRDANDNWLFRHEEICKIMGWVPGSPMAQRYASFRAESLSERLWARLGVAKPDFHGPDC